ncbi:interleukin-15-like isoform X1 [Oreochromis aureus]|uniref:interleukin-15-like isoform X1 n=1 Tax=Oreochromis aureus TaxID=47969 RepID=UPI0019530A26|nr:interleukin-15-like isoform X1 [Oreochromis aureus]
MCTSTTFLFLLNLMFTFLFCPTPFVSIAANCVETAGYGNKCVLGSTRLTVRAKRGFQIQLTCKLCRESHKTQVWLCLLVLSLLSTPTCANSVNDAGNLQKCLKQLTPSVKKSDAMLYAPRIQDFPDNCKKTVLNCYMLELKMVLREEEIEDNLQECVHDFNNNLQPSFDGCPACETYTLQNITTFMERLMDLLQNLNST